jgi:CHAD domain-containing protein
MRRGKLERIIVERIAVMQQSSRELTVSGNEEAIHDLRVAFKQLRTFVKVLALADESGRHFVPKQLRDLYQAAGVVRDLQLFHKKVVSGMDPKGKYTELIGSELKVAQRTLEKVAQKVSFPKVERTIIEHLPERLRKQAIRAFAVRNIAAINELSAGAASDDKIHTLRKRIKDVLHAAKYLLNDKDEGSLLAAKLKKMDSVAAELGRYVDCCTSLRLLASIRERGVDATERAALKSMKGHWQKEKVALKKKVTAILFTGKNMPLGFLPAL